MHQWMSLHDAMRFNMAGAVTEKRQNIWKILTLRQEEYHPQPVPLSGRLLEHRLPDYRDQVEWAKVDSQTGTKRCEICESIFKIMKWNSVIWDLKVEAHQTCFMEPPGQNRPIVNGPLHCLDDWKPPDGTEWRHEQETNGKLGHCTLMLNDYQNSKRLNGSKWRQLLNKYRTTWR